eukprot:gene1478-1865_t
MSTIPTLTYFNGQGKGEIIRLILAYTNTKFNDNRVTEINDDLRKELPYGQLPVFRDGDLYIAQSIAIARYVAEKTGIQGKTPQQRAQIDEIVDSFGDIGSAFSQSKDDAEKLNKFKTVTIPKFLGVWEKRLTEHKYIAGENFTWGDVVIAHGYSYFVFLGLEDSVQSFTKVAALSKEFFENKQVAEYVATRPASKF